MADNINLLIPRKQTVHLQKAKRYLSLLTVLLLVIFIVSTSALIVVNMLIVSQAEALESQVVQAKKTIEQRRSVESLYLVLTEKLNQADKIIKGRFDYPLILEAVNNVIPDGVTIESLSVDKKGTIVISGVAKSVPVLDVFINNLLSAEQFSQYIVTLTNTERQDDGSYSISLDIKPQQPPQTEKLDKGETTQVGNEDNTGIEETGSGTEMIPELENNR